MPAKTKASVTFRIKHSPKTKQFRCVVQARNGEVILTGEPCKNRQDVKDMISGMTNAIALSWYVVVDESEPAKSKKKPRLENVASHRRSCAGIGLLI